MNRAIECPAPDRDGVKAIPLPKVQNLRISERDTRRIKGLTSYYGVESLPGWIARGRVTKCK